MNGTLGAPSNKLVGIETLRFTAGLAVLIFHYHVFRSVGISAVDFRPTEQPFYSTLGFVYRHGSWAVQVFWTISGFIFFWKYRQSISSRAINAGNFLVLRFSRLYPLHLATLLLVALLQHLYFQRQHEFFYWNWNSSTDFLLQLFLVANRALNQDSFNYPIWSVSVEFFVYLLFFLTVRYVSRSGLVNVAVVVLCLWAESRGQRNPYIECVKLFYVGGLAAIIRQRITSQRLSILSSLAALGLAAWLTDRLLAVHAGNMSQMLSAASCTVGPLLIFSASHIPRLPSRIEHFILGAGNLTYSSYLLHFPFQILIGLLCLIVGWRIPMYEPWFFVAYLAVVLFASHYSYAYLEVPAQRLLRRISIVVT